MHLIACLLAGGSACHPHEDITDRRRCGSVERRDGVSPRRVPPCGRTVVCQDGRGNTPPVAYAKAWSDRWGGAEVVVDESLCVGRVFMVVHDLGLSAVLKG